jgi:hypothetical protein
MTPDEELKILRADWAALVAQVTGGEGANFTGDKEHPNSGGEMTDHEIALPPLPHRALRPGAGDDAMQDYARAAVMLDRQQRDKPAPSAETFSPKEIALMNEKWLHRKALGLAEAAPSAEPVITDAQVAAAERELWMGGMRDVPSEVVRLALIAACRSDR